MIPDLQPRGPFVPAPDAPIVIDLPGERVRARVLEVLADNSVVAEIVDVPMRPGTTFRQGDEVPCRLAKAEFGPAVWRAPDEREYGGWLAARKARKRRRG